MVEYTTGFWDEGTPSGTSEVRQTDEEFVSLKSSIRSIIGNEHEFDTAAADHVRGTHKKGSARAYLDVESNMSNSGTSYIGKLYVASDTSRLYVIPDSGQTAFLGGSNVPEISSFTRTTVDATVTAIQTYPGQNARWVVQCGKVETNSILDNRKITFDPLYDNPPIVVATVSDNVTEALMATVYSIDTRNAFVKVYDDAGAGAGAEDVNWISMGTVSF